MKTIGFSLYPEKIGLKKSILYLNKIKYLGFKKVFISLLWIKNKKDFLDIKLIFKKCFDNNLQVIIDVNAIVLEILEIDYQNPQFWKNNYIYGLRLDGEIPFEKLSFLIKENIHIQFNASTNIEYLEDNINKLNLNNTSVCHNFYPMRYSGLCLVEFIKKSVIFSKLNIDVGAFICATKQEDPNLIGPWDEHEGMITIEKHRNISIIDQFIEMLNLDFIDIIIIACHTTRIDLLKQISNIFREWQKYQNQDIKLIKIKILDSTTNHEKNIIKAKNLIKLLSNSIYKNEFNFESNYHINRLDNNDYFLRSTIFRVLYSPTKISPNNFINNIQKGDVIIINNNLKRYCGELHIAIQNFKIVEPTHNLVGKVIEQDLIKLLSIKGGQKWKIKITNQ